MRLAVSNAFLFSLLLVGCATESRAPAPALAEQPVPTPLVAHPEPVIARDPATFPAYVEQLKQQARMQGIDEKTLTESFARVHFIPRVIHSDRNQLEKKITLDDYLTRVLTDQKIRQGKNALIRYQADLTPVSQRYGVPASYIIALWGMESSFGKIQGKEDVISALATLAFEKRREAFFIQQLMAALTIIQQGHIRADAMTGSWAGAMGQNQFMPSSFLRYGADGDGDGKIDIWHNLHDVFASTANYLATEGWEMTQRWGDEVQLPADFLESRAGLKDEQAMSVSEWQQYGIRPIHASSFARNNVPAWVILPDGPAGRAFLVYNNFRIIMHWNRSYYFAISIGKMADAIAQ